jgi:hypothetical protein
LLPRQSRDLPVAVSAAAGIVATLAKSLIKGFTPFQVRGRGKRLGGQLVGLALGAALVGLEAHEEEERTKPHDPLQGDSRDDSLQIVRKPRRHSVQSRDRTRHTANLRSSLALSALDAWRDIRAFPYSDRAADRQVEERDAKRCTGLRPGPAAGVDNSRGALAELSDARARSAAFRWRCLRIAPADSFRISSMPGYEQR